MAKIRVPLMIQDPWTTQYKGIEFFEHVDIEHEAFFLDGPVSNRVAILDFDPATGKLLPGTPYLPPRSGRVLGRYRIDNPNDFLAPDFMRVSLFGTIYKTIQLFEEDDTLGRTVNWAFDSPQLLVIPRAGRDANAFYERDSHSLQFFFHPSPTRSGADPNFYTCLSRDIIAHETGHAILDGIAPDLYNSITPQSLALHEGIADLTALLMAFASPKLGEAVLGQTDGSIEHPTAFSSIAEEFGRAFLGADKDHGLRTVHNSLTLDQVSPTVPHALSEVLTGALYTVMIALHARRKGLLRQSGAVGKERIAYRALWEATKQFKRMIFRALDYLPPGEVSFADYARAIIAADQAAYPTDSAERTLICQQFVERKVAPNVEALQVETNFDHKAVRDIDFAEMVENDWLAYDFANRQRAFLGIPADRPFYVLPRLDVTKKFYRRNDRNGEQRRECIFKVRWAMSEEDRVDSRIPPKRRIMVGTTLAVDPETKTVRSLLTTGQAMPGEEQREHRTHRSALLARLLDQERLALVDPSNARQGRKPVSAVLGIVRGDELQVQGAGRLLHISGEIRHGQAAHSHL